MDDRAILDTVIQLLMVLKTGFISFTPDLMSFDFVVKREPGQVCLFYRCMCVRPRAVEIQRYTGSDTNPWCSHTCAGSRRYAPGIRQYLRKNI